MLKSLKKGVESGSARQRCGSVSAPKCHISLTLIPEYNWLASTKAFFCEWNVIGNESVGLAQACSRMIYSMVGWRFISNLTLNICSSCSTLIYCLKYLFKKASFLQEPKSILPVPPQELPLSLQVQSSLHPVTSLWILDDYLGSGIFPSRI